MKSCTCKECGKAIDKYTLCEDCYYDIEAEVNQLKRLYDFGLKI